ncbi:1-phosphatidylinositol 4,5-bisphosphate phosphodiesterase classes I and II [Frankliniella occidentalis]|uniref:Phosphoinositide phospholipase C n=1 Tax=Frankliniella occidentalis TaxID=133901 RepID=A0A6J1SP30_FRAOC|nr:1-phosphatidylinositol 4,5-bisphosphate phosphodiesterase classes I and II [Frankliniella occidentalis]
MASASSSTPGPTAPPPKTYGQPTVQQIKTAEVPRRLQEGEEFIKWDESSGVGTPVVLRVDENGFFLYWADQTTKEVLDTLDISLIRDARTGKYAKIPKDIKIRGKVESGIKVESSKAETPDKPDSKQSDKNASSSSRPDSKQSDKSSSSGRDSKQSDKSVSTPSDSTPGSKGDAEENVTDKIPSLCLEDCTVTICHGSDFVNLTFINFYTTKKESAQLWTDELTKLIFSLSLLNGSAIRFLMKVHTKLCLQVEKTGNIPVKSIVKMFAQNKEDKKRVEEALQSIYGPDVTKEKASVVNSAQFTFEDHFYPLYKKLVQRSEVQKIYDSLCNPATKMIGVNEFMQFLNGTQRDPRLNEILHPYAKTHNVEALIEQYERKKENGSKHQLSFDGFLRFLMSDDNPIIAPSKLEISNPEIMEHPLAHYFINSSHNTYLTGHQITGKSSVEIYRQCLLAGCRCVELDFWNGPKDEPCIVHGYTFVPEVSAKEVIEAIAECAFKTSEYPVILSFENHCNRKQQSKIAEYCREIFGDMLLDAPLDSYGLKGESLPPPSLLKRKIIIKNKKKKKGETSSGSSDAEASPTVETVPVPAPADSTVTETAQSESASTAAELPGEGTVSEVPVAEKQDLTDKDVSGVELKTQDDGDEETVNEGESSDVNEAQSEEFQTSDATVNAPIPPDKGGTPEQTPKSDILDSVTSPKANKASNGDVAQVRAAAKRRQPSGDDDDDSSSDDEAGKTDKDKASKTKETEAGEELSALVNYVQPVHFVSFEKAQEKKRFYEMSSFDEKQAISLLREYPTEFVNYNKRQLSRVYPAGIRFDSSNFMPQLFWNAGCQLVALNYQTLDLGMQYNLGMFEYNQRCGYLLKPEFFRREDRQIDIFEDSSIDGIIAGTVKITVLSGQFLSDKRVGTYVEVHMYGLPADSLRKKFRTRVVPNNGINPVYNKEEEKDKSFDCNIIVLPELASIRIAAYEESGSGKFIGHRILPLVGLCPGYRHVTLRNEAGQPLLATLFLFISVNDFVPDEFHMFAEALTNPTEYQNKLQKHNTMLAGLTEDMDEMDNDSFGGPGGKGRHGAHNGDGSKALCDRSMSDADDTVSGMIAPPKLTKGVPGSFAGLLGQAGVAASSAAAGAAAGASAAASITAKRHSIAPGAQSSSAPAVVRSTSGEISGMQEPGKLSLLEEVKKELNVETLEELMKSKAVREKRQEMDKKLEALRKKHEKERSRLQIQRGSQDTEKPKPKFYMSNKLVKRLSRQNISSGTSEASTPHEGDDADTEGALNERFLSVIREQLQQEKDLQKKYHEMVFTTLTKTVESSQSNQMKTLKALQDRDTAEMMRKLEATRRKEMKELVKKHKDREEMEKMKKELTSNAVERGVSERVRLEEMYEHKKKELEEKYLAVRSSLDVEKKKIDLTLQKEMDERLSGIKREVQIREMQIASSSDTQNID